MHLDCGTGDRLRPPRLSIRRHRLPDSGSGSLEIIWNTAETTTFTFDYTFSQSGRQTIIVETGTITTEDSPVPTPSKH
ncbi:hypothetical protein [Catellatospora tritici]|uniref:hypothetical protein n=1 Tax=Catellatospora tritici TaxID=2851566 RepID=UPI001C2DB0CF|nr:hypothetical protein [Catellatospora tritici]MBV1856386.1 hypothetical protein [Catellatospora tritici]